jgi:opacity protein-like surface antigen
MMKMTLLASVAAAGLMAAGAAAAEPTGWYGAIDAGWHAPQDVDTIAEGGVLSPQLSYEVQDDWAAFARLGYKFDQNWRVELEGGFRAGQLGMVDNSEAGSPTGICNVTPAAGACEDPDGDIESATLMANVIYDFGDDSWALRPFIGLGAGVNRVNTDYLGTYADNRAIGASADDSSTKMAAQALVGLGWAISDRAHLDLTYRYLVSNVGFETCASVPAGDMGDVRGRYEDHALTLGLRYAFGADEAPPPPPPRRLRRPRRRLPRRRLPLPRRPRARPPGSSWSTSIGIVRT